MRSLATCILLGALATTGHAQDWHFEWAHPLPTGNPLHALTFATADRGYAVGMFGTVLRSDDGGTTWVALQGYESIDANLYDAIALDENTVVTVGSGGSVYRSVDAAVTFNAVPNPATGDLRDITVIPGGGLSAAGGNGEVIVSSDGGQTWTEVGPGVGTIRRHVWTSALQAWVVGEDAAETTSDGGATWTRFIEPPFFGFNDVFFTDALTGVAFDDFGTARTFDGGLTWSHEPAFVDPLYRFLALPIDSQHWYLACFGEGAQIFETTDAGATWTQVEFRDVVGYLGLTRTPAGRLIWTSDAGDIRYTDDGGQTVVSANFNLAETPSAPILSFIDRGDGTIFASNQPNSAFDERLWIRSDDGGHSWHATAEAPDLFWAMDGVFASPMIGVVGGYEEIRCTSDGGETWDGGGLLPSGERVARFAAPTPDRIFVATWRQSGGGGLFRSVDGGATWFPFGTGVPTTLGNSDLDFIDANIARRVTSTSQGTSVLYGSVDGGATWTLISTPAVGGHVRDIEWLSSSVGVAVVPNGTTPGVHRTVNGGVTWTQVSTVPAAGLTLRSDGLGLAWGNFQSVLQFTTDGGVTWETLDFPTGAPFGIFNSGVTTALPIAGGFLVGADDNRILVLEGSAPVAVAEPGTAPALDTIVASSRPNPFRAGTTLSFRIDGSEPAAAVTIHDVAGRRVRTLAGGRASDGLYTASWDARDDLGNPVPAGVYVARVTAGKRSGAAKLTVLR